MKRVTEILGVVVLLVLSGLGGLVVEHFAKMLQSKWKGIPSLLVFLAIFISLVWLVVKNMSNSKCKNHEDM